MSDFLNNYNKQIMYGDSLGPSSSPGEMMARDAARRQMGTGPYATPASHGGSGGTTNFEWKHFFIMLSVFLVSGTCCFLSESVLSGNTGEMVTLISGSIAAISGLLLLGIGFMMGLVLSIVSIKTLLTSRMLWLAAAGGVAAIFAANMLGLYFLSATSAFVLGFAAVMARPAIKKAKKHFGSKSAKNSPAA